MQLSTSPLLRCFRSSWEWLLRYPSCHLWYDQMNNWSHYGYPDTSIRNARSLNSVVQSIESSDANTFATMLLDTVGQLDVLWACLNPLYANTIIPSPGGSQAHYTCAHPFSTSTCISLIRQNSPGSRFPLSNALQRCTLPRTTHSLKKGVVVQRRNLFFHSAQ